MLQGQIDQLGQVRPLAHQQDGWSDGQDLHGKLLRPVRPGRYDMRAVGKDT